MNVWNFLLFPLKGLFKKKKQVQELNEEFQFHLDMLIEENKAKGMSLEEAQMAARRSFGNQGSLKERCWDQRGLMWLDSLFKDIRFGFRMLAKKPGFTLIVVFSMALGIGANSTIFSFVDALLFQPLPVKDPDRLITVYSRTPYDAYQPVNYPDYTYYREHNDTFTELAAFAYSFAYAKLGDQSQNLVGELVSGNYFSVLGIQAALGRTFLPEEDRTPGTHPVVMIGHSFWQRHFIFDPDVIGKLLKINGHSFTIIGVMPKDFNGMLRGLSVDIWVPIMIHSALKVGKDDMLSNRGSGYFFPGVGRLKPGMTREHAQTGLGVLAQQLAQTYTETNRDKGISLISSSKFLVNPNARKGLMAFMAILMAVVGIVLLIACANVAILLMARNTTRKKEIAIRLAIGSSRRRLIRQLLTESLLLSALGGAVSLILALWANDLLMILTPSFPFEIALNIGINMRIPLFTLTLSLLTGVIFGMAPAWHAVKLELVPLLKDESSKAGFKKSRLRNFLVIAQVAMSLILLTAGGLLGKSLWNAQTIDPGIDTENRLVLTFEPDMLSYSDTRIKQLFRQLDERTSSLPGVKAIAWGNPLPLSMSYSTRSVVIDGYKSPPGQQLWINFNVVSPNYIRTMGIPLLMGRNFTRQDNENAPKVVIINEEMANRFWPGENPIGQRFHLFDEIENDREVIGVVKTGKYRSLSEAPQPFMHLPMLQYHINKQKLVIHTAGDPNKLLPTMRDLVNVIDNNLPILNTTYDEMLQTILMPQIVASVVLGVMGLVALLLTSIGLYGVISYLVSQRTQEIGIRISLGAHWSDVVIMVVRQGMTLVGVGIGIGLVASLMLCRFLSYLLYGLSTSDPFVFAGTSLFLILVAFTACYIPARRAAKTNPMNALRYE